MEAKEEFIVTQEWLEEMGACRDRLQAFKKHFRNRKGIKASEVLKKCEELDYCNFARWLIRNLPFNKTVCEFDRVNDHLFYNGNVHIKGDFNTRKTTYIKGALKVDGKLSLGGMGTINSKQINATEIDLSGNACLYAKIEANIISMIDSTLILGELEANTINIYDSADITGNIKTKIFNLNGGYIFGSIDADEIINDGGLIDGNVNTIKIKNINGGEVDGKITYKRSE